MAQTQQNLDLRQRATASKAGRPRTSKAELILPACPMTGESESLSSVLSAESEIPASKFTNLATGRLFNLLTEWAMPCSHEA